MTRGSIVSLALALVLSACGKSSESPQIELEFVAGEHEFLGDTAYARIMARFPAVCSMVCQTDFVDVNGTKRKFSQALMRPNDKIKLSYGMIVAFSGDFYGSPEELWEEDQNNIFTSVWNSPISDIENIGKYFKNVTEIKEHFVKEMMSVEKTLDGQRTPIEEFDVWYTLHAPNYLKLAMSNGSHFGWNNLKKYVEYHSHAINFALEARVQTDRLKRELLLRKALYWNGYADHFLTDAFAAGHVRVPRNQINDWAKAQGMNMNLAGALVKVLHDNDGGTDFDPDKLGCGNSRGDQWFAGVDYEIANGNDRNSKAIEIPVMAVERSLREVIVAYSSGMTPRYQYDGAIFAPFADVRPGGPEVPLAQKFSPNLDPKTIKGILDRASWFTKVGVVSGLTEAEILKLFRALPEIMNKFHSDIEEDLKANPELRRRLGIEYIAVMQKS